MQNYIPSQLQFSHEYCVALHDELVRLIKFGDETNSFDAVLNEPNSELAKDLSKHKDGEDFFRLLEKHKRSDVIGEILLKSLFPALLTDFCHFIFEALNSSRKGKLTVAYALLRKPLRENLHYLEWLLADPNELLATFYSKESTDLSFQKIGNPEKVKSRICKAVDQLPFEEAFDSELIFNIRYNKSFDGSFDQLCNQASHLITTKNPIKTERQNFNFIFSDNDDNISQWKNLYMTLPLILFYSVEVCELLMGLITDEPMEDYSYALFHRVIGMALHQIEFTKLDCNSENHNNTFQELELQCPDCNHSINPSEITLKKLYDGDSVNCGKCDKTLDILSFID